MNARETPSRHKFDRELVSSVMNEIEEGAEPIQSEEKHDICAPIERTKQSTRIAPAPSQPYDEDVQHPLTPNEGPELRRTTRTPRPRKTTSDTTFVLTSVDIPQKSTSPPSRRKENRVRNAKSLVTDYKSPLVTTDIVELLLRPEAWTGLTMDQKNTLLSIMPGVRGPFPLNRFDDIPNLPQRMLAKSTSMRADARLWKEDLAAGRLHPKWLAAANAASIRRANGDFDEFERQQITRDWGASEEEEATPLNQAVERGEGSKSKKKPKLDG